MGIITRHEVNRLIEKFEATVVPKEMSIGMPGILFMGLNAVKQELNSSNGIASVRLRNFARVLKHYLEVPKDPRNIHYFNHVICQVERGVDVTKAIKRARIECDPAKVQADAKKAMKRIIQREEELSTPAMA